MAASPNQPNPASPGEKDDAIPSSDDAQSPYAPRPAEPEAPEPEWEPAEPERRRELPAFELPPAKDAEKLRLAASDMVEFGLPLAEAAELHGVDPDTLRVWHRTYVNFVGKENLAVPAGGVPLQRTDFDRQAHRQFDMNWAEMMYRAERDRPQPSPMRRWLIRSRLTGWMFNGEVVDKIAVSGAACVIGFGILAVVLTTTHRGAGEGLVAPPPVEAPPGADITKFDKDQKRLVFQRVVDSIREFIALKTWEERFPYVRFPEKVGPLMEAYYKSNPDGSLEPVVLQPEISFFRRSDGEFALMQGESRAGDSPPRSLIFLIEMTGGEPEFLFDWEVLVNYEPRPWEEFSATKSTQPSPYRVRISAGDYYNGHFLDKDKFAGFKVELLGRDDEIYAFAPRGSEIATRIERQLGAELAKTSTMVLNLRFPPGAEFDNLLEIDRIVRESW